MPTKTKAKPKSAKTTVAKNGRKPARKISAKEADAGLAKTERKAEAAHLSIQHEMLKLLERVSGNKSGRTMTAMIDDGPIRIFLVALSEGTTLEKDALDGDITIQCLLGGADVTLGRKKQSVRTGELIVAPGGSAHGVKATEACALLITIAAG
jgi:quercetin dioxygenase-like cupin family protein